MLVPCNSRIGVLLVALAGLMLSGCDNPALPELAQTVAPGSSTALQRSYLFCLWNVENLFDDRDDNRTAPGDKEFDDLYARRADLLQLKLDKLTQAILAMNGGKGPDILAVVEVESLRAAQLLQQALNAKLTDPALRYEHVLMKEVTVGRHIAPALITRLPVIRDRTRGYGSRFRIVQAHVLVGGHELIVIASHWTSRVRDGNTKGRADYADQVYGAANAIHKSNPAADILVCGDFNDGPNDASVKQHLRSTSDIPAVRAGGPSLRLLNLLGDKDAAAGFGTHYYSRWYIFDQILVSPGMLDGAGWSCDTGSVRAVQALARPGDSKKRPWRFGPEKHTAPRGYSDHFPVTVELKIHP
ncbi:MAG: endonuclease/exonuclease/phosphatase family protein [Gemmataceae bacterium]|nr:endonuclease/exonuclease/phosphatase family protein [Gemmataceae bacterium]